MIGPCVSLRSQSLKGVFSRSCGAVLVFVEVGLDPASSQSRPLRRLLPDRDVVVLSLVKGSRFQPLQRSRKVIPASRAIRSSSDGHT